MEKPFYIQQLERSFEAKSKNNPRYSLRAFSRDLGVSVSRLSGIFNRKFGLSKEAAREICETLVLDKKTSQLFIDSVISGHSRSKRERDSAQARLMNADQYKDMGIDQFQIISDWHHFAIMELTRVKSFKINDETWIAKRLGISVIEVRNALERLLKFDLIKEKKDGSLELTGNFLANAGGTPSDAIRKHQKQLMKKAETAIDTQSTAEREIRSITTAISVDMLPELKKFINQFQKKFEEKTSRSSQNDEVYSLTLQFVRLTQKE
jgi:uncharacterized protein (TIGR02147 family)